MYEKYHTMDEILTKNEKRMVSFIGSHTMGSRFTDASALLTPQLLNTVTAFCHTVP
jgi:hypothetical protein